MLCWWVCFPTHKKIFNGKKKKKFEEREREVKANNNPIIKGKGAFVLCLAFLSFSL